MVRVRFSFETSQLAAVEASLHGPLDDSTITCNRNQSLRLSVPVDPLHLPNDVGVLGVQVLCRGDGPVVLALDVEDSHVSLRVADGDQVRVLLREGTGRDAVVPLVVLLRESRVFERPESKDALLEVTGLGHDDVELTVTNSNEVLVLRVDVHAADLSILGKVTGKLKEVLEADMLIQVFLFLLFDFLFLLLLLFGSA